jgi:hypothetical protein
VSRNVQRKESLFEGEGDEEVGECVCERERGRTATRINKAKTGKRRLPSAENCQAARELGDKRTCRRPWANERLVGRCRAESDLSSVHA